MSGQLGSRVDRLEVIEHLLLQHPLGLRAVELAAACAVDRRTVYRDLGTLKQRGLPLEQVEGRFRLRTDEYALAMRFTLPELLALVLTLRYWVRYAEDPVFPLAQVAAKLQIVLPGSVESALHDAESQLAPLHDRNTRYNRVLAVLFEAWLGQRKAQLWYRSVDGRKANRCEIALYLLEPQPNGRLLATGYDETAQRVRQFYVHRIERARVLTTPFQLPAAFSARRYLNGVLGYIGSEAGETKTRVTLRFASHLKASLRHRLWHISQQSDWPDERPGVVQFTVTDWRDLLPWVRSWGRQVEVLEPVMMREALAREFQDALSQYTRSAQI